MSWALSNNHPDVVKLIIEKDTSEVDDVLMNGVRSSNEELVKVALDKGGVKPQTLTAALATSTANPKNAGIVEMLKKAGAVAPPEIDAATLQSYAGKYKGDPGPEFTMTVKDGKLVVTTPQAGGAITFMAIDKTTFRPVDFEGITFTFIVEGGNVTGATFKQGPNTTQLKRVAETKP